MTVATSDALAALARSEMTSSLTDAPLPVSGDSSEPPASIRHTYFRAGTWSRKLSMICSWSPVSTKQARAPELASIHSACSAEEVS